MPNFAPLQTITLGDFKITYLPDGGGVVNPLALYPASTEAGWQKHQNLLDDNGKFITTIGGYLIEIGDRKIAVDQGIGPVNIDFPGFGPFFGGNYPDSLQQTGVSPTEITDVLYTHLHLDHCGWTTLDSDGQRRLTFPKAGYFVTQTEWEFWQGGDNPVGPHPEFVQKPLAPHIQFITPGREFVPGLTVVDTAGHTPGHVSLLLKTGSQRLYVLGDVLHGVMQLDERDWGVAFDADAEAARKIREALYPELVKPDTLVAVNHFSNGVFGSITKTDGQLSWQPIE